MDDSVAGWDIGSRYGRTVDHNGISNCEREWIAVDGGRRQTIGYVRSRNFSIKNVVQKDICKCSLAFRIVEACKVNACVGKGLIGWCKDREWTITLQRLKKFCLNDAGNQRIVLSCALCSPWNVVWCIGWHQDLVNDVDDTVACGNVSQADVGIVDHDATVDGERKRLAVDSICTHALGDGRRWYVSSNDVIEQNVGEDCLPFWSVKRSEIDACIGESLVGWGKDREWPLTLKCLEQFSLDNRCYKRVVNACTLRRSRNVVRGIRWHQYLVDDVNDSVACHHIRERDICVVDHDTAIDGEGKRLTIDSICRHALTDVGCWYFSSDDVVEKDV